MTATETTADTTRALLRKMAIGSAHVGAIMNASLASGVRSDMSCAPNRIIAPFCRTSAMPSVRMSWA